MSALAYDPRALDSRSGGLYTFAPMKHGQASRTALSAAGHRAAHQALEGGSVFPDPLALVILGDEAEEAVAAARERPERRALRIFVAMRSRFAEDCAKAAICGGVQQILVLGAGLDTFAYRLENYEGVRVFELDHPATQRDKRRRLAEAGIAEPAHLAYVAHDFDHGSMTVALQAGGLDTDRRTIARAGVAIEWSARRFRCVRRRCRDRISLTMPPMSIFGFARTVALISGVLGFAAIVGAQATPSDPARFVASIYANGREPAVWRQWPDGARRGQWFSSA
jgi:hypothetical protein